MEALWQYSFPRDVGNDPKLNKNYVCVNNATWDTVH